MRTEPDISHPVHWVLLTLALVLSACEPARPSNGRPKIATTTSYLEAVVQDLLQDTPQIVRLAEPGTCPGHFDIRPSQVRELQNCVVMLRFDFQKALDARCAHAGTRGPAAAEISLRGGMCLPDSYLAACRQTAEHLVSRSLLSRTVAEERLQEIADRLEKLSHHLTNRVSTARLVGVPVLASERQRDFCQWLGLAVQAAFKSADSAGFSEIEEAIDRGKLAQIKLVVANRPEGRRTADALAERLKARVVVFENFPEQRNGPMSFDAMISGNVDALVRAAAP
ncbi:MAG: metal ABC transporter solute-binding protein, Zn/Mn family [Verrucomicrobiia bacterium]